MQPGATRRLRRHRLCGLLCAAALAFSCIPLAAAKTWPRAEFAASCQRTVAAVDDLFGDATALALAHALAGPSGEEALLSWLGDFATALDAPAQADRAWTRALAAANRNGDADAARLLTLRIARSALALGDYPRAREFAQRLLEFGRRDGDVAAQAHAQNMLGILERRGGHLDAAIDHQQRARKMFEADGNTAWAMRALSDLGTVWRDRGDFAKALEAQLDAVGSRDTGGDRLEHVYRNLGLLYRDIDDAATSRDYFAKALQAADAHGAPSAYSTVVGSYASLLNETRDCDGARDGAEEALAIDEALGDRAHQGLDHLELGRALLCLRDGNGASEHFEKALALGREVGQREIVARALLHLTQASMAARDTLRARGLVDEAVASLESTHLRPQLADAYALREQLAQAEHDDATALRYAHKAAALREELGGLRASRQLAALEVRHERADADQHMAMLAKDNELQAERIERQSVLRDLSLLALGSVLCALGALIWRHRGVRRLNRELERQRAALDAANAMLRAQADDLRLVATTDPLTQVANRRHLLECLDERLVACAAQARPLALLLVDFDHFKKINDLRGHLFGDQVLVLGAAAIRASLGADDVLGRFGGEEFVVLVRDRGEADVLALADRVRQRVGAALANAAPELAGVATISVGIAFLADLGPHANAAALLDAADRALYLAKDEGRNRVRRFAA